MTLRLATIGTILICAGLFAGLVPPARLFAAVQPLLVAASIMAAAILVRLNRAMPTLDWKSLEPAGRRQLTQRVVDLNKEYLSILAVQALLASALISLVVAGDTAVCQATDVIARLISGGVGGLLGLAVFRMGYVAWRDYDIVKLQKHLIDAAGDKDFEEAQNKAASEVVATIKTSELQRYEQKKPSDWNGNE